MATNLKTTLEERDDAQRLEDEMTLSEGDADILVRRIERLMPSITATSAARVDRLLRLRRPPDGT